METSLHRSATFRHSMAKGRTIFSHVGRWWQSHRVKGDGAVIGEWGIPSKTLLLHTLTL